MRPNEGLVGFGELKELFITVDLKLYSLVACAAFWWEVFDIWNNIELWFGAGFWDCAVKRSSGSRHGVKTRVEGDWVCGGRVESGWR
jgi:hypothetical protein